MSEDNLLLVGRGLAAISHKVQFLELIPNPPLANGTVIYFFGRMSRPKFVCIEPGDELKLTLVDMRFGMIQIVYTTEEELTFCGALS